LPIEGIHKPRNSVTNPRGHSLKLAALFASAALALAAPTAAQAQLTKEYQQLQEFGAVLDHAATAPDFVGLAIAVVKDGQVALMKTYGVREAGGTEKVTPDTVFRIASLSKGFAGTLAVMEQKDGKLDLQTRVATIVPEFKLRRAADAARVTLEDVLSQRTGLPPYAYDNLLEAGRTPSVILSEYAKVKQTCPPGECFTYQNVAFNMIATAIEKASGKPYAAELKARFEERSGAVVIEGYGLTESSGVVSCNPYEGLNKLGSIGQPIPGTDVKLLDKEDPTKPAPEGEPGELVFAGPQVMCGYWKRPDADAEVFVGKYLRTGDVATIDEDGFIHIVDRLKDMIAVGGFKVFPSQVEDVLYKHPAVKEALVIGVPDAYHGEMPRAFVTLQDGATEDGAALMAWLNPQLGKHERVQAVVVREALPKTMIGKLDRKALRAEIGC